MIYTPATPREAQKLAATITESSRIPREVNGRFACIVRTEANGDYWFGVQFWTPEMIEGGSTINTDRTRSLFIQKLDA